MVNTMSNEAEIKGKWNQLKGKAKEKFGELTDDDLLKLDGSTDQMIGALQTRYGYSKERALREWNNFIDQYDLSTSTLTKKPDSKIGNVAEHVQEVTANALDSGKKMVSDAVDEVLDRAQSSLDEQKNKVTQRLDNVAGALRNSGQELRQGEQVTFAEYANSAAEYVDGFSNYLRKRHPVELWNEVQSFAYRQPEVFVLGTMAAGFLLGRFLRKSEPNPDKVSHAGQPTPERYLRPAVNHSQALQRQERYGKDEQPIPIQGATSNFARERKNYATEGGASSPNSDSTPALATPTSPQNWRGNTRAS